MRDGIGVRSADATKKIEDGIRSYLDSVGVVQKPVVDREAVKQLRAEIKSETDSIKKLYLLAALEVQRRQTPLTQLSE